MRRTKEIKYASPKLWGKRGEMCRLQNRCVRIGDSTYLSSAHVCGKSGDRRYARGHRECFIFSGLSNRCDRYVHALAAINDLISVSFHLPDYGQNSGAPVGRCDGDTVNVGNGGIPGGYKGESARRPFFTEAVGLLLRFRGLRSRTRGNLPLACNVTSREECH